MAQRIGFIDKNLDNFHARTFHGLITGDLAGRGFEVSCAWAMEPDSRAWAEERGIAFCASVEEMADLADFFVIVAPSDPEVHLELATRVLPLGKSTYIDKTFAPDAATAAEIFDLAERHGVATWTSSALRFDEALEAKIVEAGPKGKILHIQTWGGGRSFEEYAIHPIEMAVSAMGPDVEAVMRTGTDTHSQVHIRFAGGRSATVHVYTEAGKCPYASMVTTADATVYVPSKTDTIFKNLVSAVLDFFNTDDVPVDRAETMAIMKIRDAALKPEVREAFITI